jgi:endonuclease/exonuclease/phosphatase family metal-dependent hydrolase
MSLRAEGTSLCREVARIHELIRERIAPCLAELRHCRSTAELHRHPLYRKVAAAVETVLGTPETADHTRGKAPARSRYRFLAWNIERGTQYEGQLAALRAHPYLKDCDVLLLTETDVGMARSGNRAVAQSLAAELGFQYAFVPCYLSLVKGSGLEYHVEGENRLGLHGNAILSRYPITRVRPIALKNGIDKMAGREKRIGRQAAVAADIDFPNLELTAVSVHLDAQSSQRHRREQMGDVLDAVDGGRPVILGGDWNTSTYNSSRALRAILGFWLRVMMGVDHVIRNHYLHPDRRFERELFDLLETRGFDYRSTNLPGERTAYYHIDDPKARHSLGDWVPGWCFAFIHWALRNHGGQCPLKLDWFATRGLRCANPVVLHELRNGQGEPLSDHDPIGLEVLA